MTVSGNPPLELAPRAGCGRICVEAAVCGCVGGAGPSLLCPHAPPRPQTPAQEDAEKPGLGKC